MAIKEQREHIHDMANSITVIQAAIQRVLKRLEENPTEYSEEIQRLMKADNYVKKTIVNLRELRADIIAQSGP